MKWCITPSKLRINEVKISTMFTPIDGFWKRKRLLKDLEFKIWKEKPPTWFIKASFAEKIKRNEGEQWPTLHAVVHERSLESHARHMKMTDLKLNPSVWWWVLDPKNRRIELSQCSSCEYSNVCGFQTPFKFGKPFHVDKVYWIKIFTTLQRFVQVNVFSSLEVDCLTSSAIAKCVYWPIASQL